MQPSVASYRLQHLLNRQSAKLEGDSRHLGPWKQADARGQSVADNRRGARGTVVGTDNPVSIPTGGPVKSPAVARIGHNPLAQSPGTQPCVKINDRHTGGRAQILGEYLGLYATRPGRSGASVEYAVRVAVLTTG